MRHKIEVKKLNIAICDDEENVRIYIQKLIQKQNVSCEITEFLSGEELLQIQNREDAKPIDILFLDISAEGTDGMNVAKQLRNQMESRQEAVWGSLPLLIFVTGNPEYMPEAFSVNAFQYILKPIRERDFEKVFAQAMREYQYLVAKRQEGAKEVFVRNRNTTRRVSADDIYYIESSNRKVVLYLQQEKIEYYDKISDLERELKPDFFRIHKGYLVNMKYVERYNRTELWMKNGDRLLISKYKYQDFVKSYLEYISEEK
ncbi:MAG: LytTR family DNA-binding domain-containing protein [Roseburia sp.]|nr:LytTR family DNA-binding domain-containing protein [Roseburia sp.]